MQLSTFHSTIQVTQVNTHLQVNYYSILLVTSQPAIVVVNMAAVLGY